MTDRPLLYWDSVVFISFLTGRDPNRLAMVRALLVHLDNAKFDLVTSTFTRAEVRYFRTGATKGPPNDPGREAAIAELFASPKIEFRAVTDFVGKRAWEIGCQYTDVSPADAVHIATAEDVGAYELFTWDGSGVSGTRHPEKMLSYDGVIGIPPLAIKEPHDPWPGMFTIEDPGRKGPSLGSGPVALPPPSAQSRPDA